MLATLLTAVAQSDAAVYCYTGTPPNSQCPTIGIANFTTGNVNRAYYYGTPGIGVCQRVTNSSGGTTVSRRCGIREISSFYDIINWVQCSGGSPYSIRFIAGNDSNVTHTIEGSYYYSSAGCA